MNLLPKQTDKSVVELVENLGRSNGMKRCLWLTCVTLLLVAGPLGMRHPARANGIDLPQRSGNPGDRITVTGHDWLACCPPNTPVARVTLYMIRDDERIQLFEVAADSNGEIAATFTVPEISSGEYALLACGDHDGEQICLPEGTFTVLLPATGFDIWPAALGAALAVTGLVLLLTRRLPVH